MPGWETVDESPKPKASGWETVEDEPAPKPKETGIIGWAKGKMAESEARRQEMMKNPGKAFAAGLANIPILPGAPGSIVRGAREIAGNQTPYAIERILPDPTLGSVAKGVVDAPIKGAQIGQHVFDAATGGTGQGLATDRLANWVDEAYRTPGVVQSQMGEMVGQSLLPLSIGAKGKSAIEGVKKANMLIRALKGGATGAAIGVSSTPDVGVQSNADFAKRQVMPALVGGALGAVVPTALGAVESMASRRLTPEAQAIQDLGDKFGVRTLAPDLTKAPGPNKLAVLAESVPGSGMVNQRLSQQAEARAAAQKLLDQHGIEGDAATKIQEGLQNRLASAKASAKGAYDEVGRLAEGKGEVPLDQTLKAIQDFRSQETSAVVPDQGLVGLLDKMEGRIRGAQSAPAVGLDTSYLSHLSESLPRNTAKQGGAYAQASAEAAAATKKAIATGSPADHIAAQELNTKAAQAGTVARDASGNFQQESHLFHEIAAKRHGEIAASGGSSAPASTNGVDLSFNGVRGLRSDLGSMISDYYKGTNAATGSKGVQVLQGVKGAIEGDLNAFTTKNGPEIASAAKRADSIYKGEVVPFKDKALAAAVKSSEPDQIYRAFIQQGKGDRAQKFYAALDADGQAAVRSQMVKDAFEASTVQDGVFSPAKFAQSLEKIKDSTGVFFKGQDKFELDGFTNLMRHIQRAGQVGENPTNGQRAIQALIMGEGAGAVGAAFMGHPGALVAPALSVASARGLTKLFSSKAGKSLLLGASGSTPGTPAMEKLVEKDLPRLLGIQASAPNVSPLRTLPTAASTEPNTTLAENQP